MSTQADADGNFAFHTLGIPPGKLIVSKPFRKKARFDITPGTVNTIDASLAPWRLSPYIHTPYVDFGPISTFFAYNQVERVRLCLPVRTTALMSRRWLAGAYVAYGFRDRAWKYMAEAGYRFDGSGRQILRLRLSDDYIATDANAFDYLTRDAEIFSPGHELGFDVADFFASDAWLNRNRELTLSTVNGWGRNLTTTVAYRAGQLHYGDPTARHAWQRLPFLSYHSLDIALRLQFDGSYADGHFSRRHIAGRKPVISFGARLELSRADSTPAGGRQPAPWHAYAIFQANLHQRIQTSRAGHIDYTLQLGHIAGIPPNLRAHHLQGNDGYGYDSYRFSLLPRSAIAATTHAQLFATWDAEGRLLAHIPGIRRLKLHELVQFKGALGLLDRTHADDPRTNYTAEPRLRPYAEAGVGLGNILGVAALWSIWRITPPESSHHDRWKICVQLDLAP